MRSLDAEAKAAIAPLVEAALGEVAEKKDSLSARLAFGKLNRRVRPVAVTGADGGPGPEGDPYLMEDIVARVAFVVGLSELLPPDSLSDVLTTLYRTGSDREQIAILRALPLLDAGERLVALAREASRTNDVTVFCALACSSDFPARYLPDAAFDQLVLKALFLGVPVPQIANAETRATAELQRMVSDFSNERRAAGRPVPSDVPWLLGLAPSPNRTERK